jgi:hypothetical protein
MKIKPSLLIVCTAILTGCAFDISHVRQLPISFTPSSDAGKSFILDQNVRADLGTGFATRLKADTRWEQVGHTEYGDVFATKDQIVAVEASNIYEAQLVVSNQFITGFYLIVEKKFSPVTRRIPIETRPIISTQSAPSSNTTP